MKVVYARADKVPEDCDYITEGKLYPVVTEFGERKFVITCDSGGDASFVWDGVWSFQRLEYPYRDPEAVEALIEAARVLDLAEVGKALARLSPAAALGGE